MSLLCYFFLSEVCFLFPHFEQPENYSFCFNQCCSLFFVKFELYCMYPGLLAIRWSESLAFVLHIFSHFLHLSLALCFLRSIYFSASCVFNFHLTIFNFLSWTGH